MRTLDLFSGIGGFSLAATWVWGDELDIHSFIEIDPFCQKILKKHWPKVPIHDDIRSYKHDGTTIDLITTGFPCQDISTSGKGEGIKGKRSGLWFESFRIIRDIRPKFIIIENVATLLVKGGDEVLSCLASIGYNAEWQVLSAKDANAWHTRKRLFIVAYPNGLGLLKIIFQEGFNREKHNTWPPITTYGTYDFNGRTYPKLAEDLGVVNGVSETMDRTNRLKALGNAIVPQVVVPIMQAIKEIDNLTRGKK